MFYKSFLIFPVVLFFSSNLANSQAATLEVSDNGRYLQYENGDPFFYLGDTAWELFHRLDLNEANRYLENRAAKGFSVIQAVVLAQLGGLTVPNANGDLPLENGDPQKPIDSYFQHVDAVVRKAEDLGLYVGMLPTWGSYWTTVNGNGKIFDPESARSFGKFLGTRYRDSPIIWILGGDENINRTEERDIIEAMVEGLKEGDGGRHLCTFHPRGPGRSSDYFHDASWLDFNMFQSSHAAHDHDNGLFAEYDYGRSPRKPTLDGEPRYELIPAGFYLQSADGFDLFDDYDCRQAAYWSVLAGACGHTYGHNSIWQMWSAERQPVLGAVIPWDEALDHPGSFQMKHLRRLFAAYPYHELVPDHDFVVSGPASGGAKVRAAVAESGRFAVVYSPRGLAFTIDQSRIVGLKLKAAWFDPRYGIWHEEHTGNTFALQTYTPPTQGRGRDWVLVLEGIE